MGLFDLFKGKGKRLEDEKTWDESASNDDIEDDDSESLSVYDAALIWASNGKDEDYTFGYTEEELEDALR